MKHRHPRQLRRHRLHCHSPRGRLFRARFAVDGRARKRRTRKLVEHICDDQKKAKALPFIAMIQKKGLGLDETYSDHEARTALHTASALCHEDIVQTLIDSGANVNAQDHQGKTPLRLAVEQRHDDIVRALIVSGTNGVRLLIDVFIPGRSRIFAKRFRISPL